MKKSTPAQFAARLGIYCLGLLILAFGIALSVNSNLGVSPVSSLPYVVSRITNVSLGTCTTVIYMLYILLQMALSRQKFQPALLVQLVFSTVFGYFVDGAKLVLGDFVLPTYFGQLAMLAASVVLIGLSLVLYIDVQLVPMPAEGLVGCIADRTGKPFSSMKVAVDCASVLAAAALSVLFLGGLMGVREGTVITALLAGRMMGVFRKWLSPLIRRICFGE